MICRCNDCLHEWDTDKYVRDTEKIQCPICNSYQISNYFSDEMPDDMEDFIYKAF